MSGSLLDTSVLIAHDEDGALELPETAAISVARSASCVRASMGRAELLNGLLDRRCD